VATFRPRVGQLLPPLTGAQELAILARSLWREGYDDHLAGHITVRQPDGTFLTNPWFQLWEEVRPSDVVQIDLDGEVLAGAWPPAPGVQLHLALHRRRHDVGVAIHHHPRWATVWADARRLPPCLDQTSALGGGVVTLVDEYEGAVTEAGTARSVVDAMGDADVALLGGHGLFVLGRDLRQAHLRAVAFEQRCRVAFQTEALGGGRPLPADIQAVVGGAEFDGFWEAMARRELRADPSLLADPGTVCVARPAAAVPAHATR
jgi:ribulose-5-phosphate 4-epimerase/fuculose-1-phosphate aldolase